MHGRNEARLTLTLGHLYPDQLNLYGDRGNILTLKRRCELRGIELRVVGLGIGDALAPDEYDLLFIGGGQDKEQAPVAQDLFETKGIGLWAAIEDDMPVLAVCGGYQLLAHYYRPAEGPDMKGLGVFDAWTVHKGPRTPRCIGDVVISWNGMTIVGFENHGGRTYLGTARPLGKVLKGHGNNAEDGTEGAVYRNAYGTYLHGSLLPKNPHFADYLIGLALQRKYGLRRLTSLSMPPGEILNGSTPAQLTPVDDPTTLLRPLDDRLEWQAHAAILERLGLYEEAVAALRRAEAA
ncbi:glutamine amidotransferase [Thermogemmatispora aurantia]|jgi:CobQ-like glutamine amidotransferase family enzyme|uniref:Lipid II isoglutaminyl synthase (glutamine-hydrolyzing) subunit GatD n=1 Tax=Thermogemmatispora aurantia TaxID=2045279 RepID=A0A5J4K4C4_9CHLR|nr:MULTISPECIES: glutamine amidotransferase [Thermogemmatispora]GER81539.1 glutamine amidotransferase [Thermogemmatispora aurantia]